MAQQVSGLTAQNQELALSYAKISDEEKKRVLQINGITLAEEEREVVENILSKEQLEQLPIDEADSLLLKQRVSLEGALTLQQLAQTEGLSEQTRQYLLALIAKSGYNVGSGVEIGLDGILIALKEKLILQYQRLAAAMGLSNAGLAILLGIAAAATALIIIEQKRQKAIKESIETMEEATDEQNEYNDSLNESIDKYDELAQKLSSLSSKSAKYADVKEDLLELQNELQESYEDEFEGIDLVNGAYNEQLRLLKQKQTESAATYVKDNKKDYENNQTFLERYRTSQLTISSDIPSEIKSVLENNGLDILNDGFEDYINLSGTTQEIVDIVTNALSDLNNLDDTAKDNSAYKQIVNWLENIEQKDYFTEVPTALDNIETYCKMLALGDASYSKTYTDFEAAAEEYNAALASHDQDRIEQAKTEFEAQKTKIDIDSIDDDGIRSAFQAIADSISEYYLKSNSWYVALNSSDAQETIAEHKGEYLADEMEGVGSNFTSSEAGRYLQSLTKLVGGVADEDMSQFIAVLEDLGIVIDDITDNDPSAISDLFTNANEKVSDLVSNLGTLYDSFETLTSFKGLNSANAGAEDVLNSLLSLNEAAIEVGKTFDWESILEGGEIDEDVLDEKIQELGDKWKEDVLDQFAFDKLDDETRATFEPFVNNLLDSVVASKQATTEFNNMTTALDNLQSSYTTLKDIMTDMNKGNGISLDQLQELINADENYIQMLTVENGQLTLNISKYKEMVAEELLVFKDKLDNAAAAEILALAEEGEADARYSATEQIVQETGALGTNTTAAIANGLAHGVSKDQINAIVRKYAGIWNAAVKQYNTNFDAFMGGSDANEDNTDEYKELLDAEIEMLDAQLDAGYIDFKDYMEKRRALVEKYYADNLIDAADYYQELADLYDKQLETYDTVISAVEKVIDDEIEVQQDKIDAIDDEIDKLDEANEARETALNLSKAQYELEKAKNQRTKLVYKNGQMSYITDQEAIRDAKSELDDAVLEKQKSDLEDQKEAIQDVIDALEDYKEEWEEIADLWDDMQAEKLAESVLGAGWKDKILSMDPDILQNFSNDYVALEQLIADNQIPLAEANYNEVLNNILNELGSISASLAGLIDDDDPAEKARAYNLVNSSGAFMGKYATKEDAEAVAAKYAEAGVMLTIDEVEIAAGDYINTLAEGLAEIGSYVDAEKKEVSELTKESPEYKYSVSNQNGAFMGYYVTKEDAMKVVEEYAEAGVNLNVEAIGKEVTDAAVSELFNNIKGIQDTHTETYGVTQFTFKSNRYNSEKQELLSDAEPIVKEVVFDTVGEDKIDKFIAYVDNVDMADKIVEFFATTDDIEERTQYVQQLIDSVITEHYTDFYGNADNIEETVAYVRDSIATLPDGKTISINIQYNEDGSVVGGDIKSEKDLFERFGSSNVSGNAFASGTIGAEESSTALVGEVGEELVVHPHEGTWETVGTNGAEFTEIDKDDIVFNHKQTEALLKNGHTNSRGRAYASGKNNLTPLATADPDKFKLLNSFIPNMSANVDIMKTSIMNVDASIREMADQMEKISKRQDSNSAPMINVTNPVFQCTGVTGEQVLHQIENSFAGIFTKAYQQSMK